MGNSQPQQPLEITVADGGIIHSVSLCEDIKWHKQGYDFCTNAIAILLSSCDIILGMQWLRQWGTISWDFTNLIVEFYMEGIEVKFQATRDGKDREKSLPFIHNCVKHNEQ